MDLFRLDDRIALITGGSRGIGLAIAHAYARAGAHVIITARGADALEAAAQSIRTESGSAEARVLDVADIEAGQALVEAIVREHGRLDILVNNAGMNIREPAVDVQPDHLERILNVNLRGAFFLSQAAGRVMLAQRRGKVINIASLSSFIGLSRLAAYAMSKGALLQMTRVLSTEWAAYNVQVNAIAPGFIVTDLNRKLWENEAVRNWVLGNTPAGRLGSADDIAGAAIFLASRASDYVTGQVIIVDGGLLGGGPWPL